MKTYIDYAKKVVNNEIIACEYIQLACKQFLHNLERSDIEFKEEKVDRVINFIKHLKHFTGQHNNKPFILQPWQQWIVASIFGFYYTNTNERVVKNVYIEIARKNGKALSLDTKLYTPNGYTTMGDVKEGDVIIGADGKETTITYTTPIQYNHNCYKVTFEDGEEIIADAEHNWYVKDRYARNTHVKTTNDLLPNYNHIRKDGKGIEYNYRVPMNNPIEYSEKSYTIDPYVLGLWLGDGDSAKPNFTVEKKDLPMYDCLTSTYGEPKINKDKRNPNTLHLSYAGDKGKNNSLLRHHLIDVGVFKNKHIPNEYLFGSIEQRLSLLQGLMDTDGTIDKGGQCEFVQKNKDITDGLCTILSSLGIKYTRCAKKPIINGKECDEVQRVTFFTDKTKPCFRLKRKYDKLKDRLNKRMLWKSIIGIEKVDSVPVRCITVDNADHLYLCGDKCTVTHNTAFAAALCLYALIADGENNSEVELIANSRKQASICFDMCSNFCKSIDSKGKFFKYYRDNIKYPHTKSFLQVLSSDASNNDGWNSYLFVADEVHSYDNSKMFDVMKSSQGMRNNPLAISITTAGFNLYSFCYGMRQTNIEILRGAKQDDSQFTAIFTLDNDDDWENEDNWVKANPNLGVTVKPQYLREQIQQAKNNPSLEVSTKTKNFNMWLQTSDIWIGNDDLLKVSETVDIEELAKEGYTCYMGVDLAAVSDLTALTMLIPMYDKYLFKTWYFLPSATLFDNSNADLYKEWKRRGELIITDGNVTDYDAVTNMIMKVGEKIPIERISYDNWNATEWAIRATELGLPLIPYSQAIGNFNKPTKALERAIKQGTCIIDNNTITRWCFSNVILKRDWNENIKPTKAENQQKIDGVIAMIMALGGLLETPQYSQEILSINGN